MAKILGLDLGTNTIGWAIRDTDVSCGSQIIDKGVIVYKKGVGVGKSGEFSLAAERRKHRSKRHLYNAKRYRKWKTLEVLIENNMCPLAKNELNLWRIGEWNDIEGKKKNLGRKYPLSSSFISWLKMDFDKDGKNDYTNPYILRTELIENYNENDSNRLYKIGRAFYHLTQRRGFKSSRKSGKSAYGESEILKKFYEKHPDKKEWKISQIWKYLQSDNCPNNELKLTRIRKETGVLKREEYEKEFWKICETQKIVGSLSKKLYKAIYHVRGVRSQKGNVGKCTFETNKPRLPISHPLFEEFRALQFINNIKYRLTNTNNNYDIIPLSLKKQIFENLFFRNNKNFFKFDEIVKKYSNNGEYEFNYKNNPSVPTCPVISGLMKVFNEEWQNKFIQCDSELGINWDGLIVNYNTLKNYENKEIQLDYEGIWHLLFDYLLTKDNEEDLINFAKVKFNWDNNKAEKFASINIQQGYAALSRSAIKKILPYLQKGFIYNEAVVFANLEKVIGKDVFEENKDDIIRHIINCINNNKIVKDRLNIINNLIQKYFTDREYLENAAYILNDNDKNEIIAKVKKYFGESLWQEMTEAQKNENLTFIFDTYQSFMQGKQKNEEKASYKEGHGVPKFDYYRLPRQDSAIKQLLKEKYQVSDSKLKYLYHPSDIDIYPLADEKEVIINGQSVTVKQLGNPQPPTKGFKNPMAMRSLHELKKLLNYLLAVEKINENTRIVIEIPRELNNANYRKAYTDWVSDREKENIEFSKAMAEIPWNINSPSEDDYNKFRSAVEQLDKLQFIENKTNEFNQKYKDFVTTYLKSENHEENEEYDYIMYLILNREEFVRMLNYLPPGTNKWVTQLIKTSKGFRDKLKSLKEMLIKYRLWKEQKFQCIYTGRIIPLTNLFDATKCQIEHTIPRSISFDSELKNLTVCDSVYNNIVKNKQFPTQCPNYIETTICSTIDGNRECTPIINRVNDLIKPKVDELKKRISDLKATAKKIPDWEVDKRNANIRLRHYLYFELQYWEQKLFTFTVKKEDWKDKFKNSQLVDTQIITKYARAYLKSLFKRVDVQKATVVHTFREEIYNLPEKTRDKHSHHAVDAAVLTLIPGSASRDKQMKEYFEWKEGKNNNYVLKLPYNDFNKIHIKDDIENSVIINHTYKDTALTPSKKYARYRGRKVYIFDEYGNKIPKILQGDSIRGQLHKESYFGAIKVNERNKDGFPIKQNGKYIVKQKDEEDIIWIVCRKEIKEVDFNKDIIIDELLKKHINQQLDNGVKQNELTDFKGKRIRHLRCRYKAGKGFLTNEKAIPIKNHVFKSKYPHKQNYLTQNEENYLYLLYEGKDKNNKSVRGYKLLNLFNIASLNLKDIKHLKNEPEFKKLQKKRGKNTLDLELKDILKVGDRVILFKKSKDEITNNNVKDKLFNIFKFNEPAPSTAYIYFQNHIESRPDDELKKLEEKDFNPEKYQARIFLTCEKLNFLLENKDFKINLDGTIEWLY